MEYLFIGLMVLLTAYATLRLLFVRNSQSETFNFLIEVRKSDLVNQIEDCLAEKEKSNPCEHHANRILNAKIERLVNELGKLERFVNSVEMNRFLQTPYGKMVVAFEKSYRQKNAFLKQTNSELKS